MRYYAGFDSRKEGSGELLHRQIATELYVTLIYRPCPTRATRLFKRLTTRNLAEIRTRQAEDLDSVADMARQFETSMKRYGPQRLATFSRNGVVYSEMAAFLGFLANGVWEDVPLRRAQLAEYLSSSRLHFGDKNGMLEIWHSQAHKFAGFLDFQDYPKFSEPGMNNAILYGAYEYIETQSFSILNKHDAMKALERQAGQLTSSEDASASRAEAIARHEGFSLTRWIVALINARLEKAPQLGQRELEVLARSNLQMLAIGRNLNQLAQAANNGIPIGTGGRDLIEALRITVMHHADQVASVMTANTSRWSH